MSKMPEWMKIIYKYKLKLDWDLRFLCLNIRPEGSVFTAHYSLMKEDLYEGITVQEYINSL